jgi:hypothetical protein
VRTDNLARTPSPARSRKPAITVADSRRFRIADTYLTSLFGIGSPRMCAHVVNVLHSRFTRTRRILDTWAHYPDTTAHAAHT